MASRSRASAESLPSVIAAAALTAFAVGPAAEKELPCGETDRACAFEAGRKHPVHQLRAWSEPFKLPVEQRFGPAPDMVVDALRLDNIANGFPERPHAAHPSAQFMADVKGAIEELPPAVRRILGGDLAGIYFVEDLGGTGFTNSIRDGDKAVGAFVVLDAAVLDRYPANAWATWKESSPFRRDAALRLEAKIEESRSDTRKYAIQYILLHELGHVLSVTAKVVPDWNIRPEETPVAMEYPYFRLSWRIDRPHDRYESLFDERFTLRKDLAYYVGAKLSAKDMAVAYTQLEATNYPTLYAATHPADDFAEAFANYVHVVLMKKPFEITLLDDGRVVRTYGACWTEPRCAAKRRILEDLLHVR
jgi:hypothetical protein